MDAPLFGVGFPGVEVVECAGCYAYYCVPEWCEGEEFATALGAEDSPRLIEKSAFVDIALCRQWASMHIRQGLLQVRSRIGCRIPILSL